MARLDVALQRLLVPLVYRLVGLGSGLGLGFGDRQAVPTQDACTASARGICSPSPAARTVHSTTHAVRCHGAKPERAARDARPSWAAERAPSQTRVPALATGLCRPGSAERGALCEAACRTFLSSCPWPGMLETPVPLPSLPPDLMKAVQTEKAFSVPSAASASSDMEPPPALGRRRDCVAKESTRTAKCGHLSRVARSLCTQLSCAARLCVRIRGCRSGERPRATQF